MDRLKQQALDVMLEIKQLEKQRNQISRQIRTLAKYLDDLLDKDEIKAKNLTENISYIELLN